MDSIIQNEQKSIEEIEELLDIIDHLDETLTYLQNGLYAVKKRMKSRLEHAQTLIESQE